MAQYEYPSDITYDNPYVTYHDQPRKDLIRVVFVDFTASINNPEMMIDPSSSYHEFLSGMTELTAPVAYLLPRLDCPKFPGQGLALEDGNWLYRIVKPFNYDFTLGFFTDAEPHDVHIERADMMWYDPADTSVDFVNVHRSGTDTDEWSILNSPSGYQRMIDRMGYGYRLEGAWIEIQHQSQKDRDERAWALATAPDQTMNETLPESTYLSSSASMRHSSIQDPQLQMSDIIPGRPPQSPEPDQALRDQPLLVDGRRARTTIKTTPEAQPTSLASPDPSSETSQSGSLFIWQPPKPGELKAPAASQSMPLALPPSASTMPTTIDPTLLQYRPDKAVPQVNMPKSKTWKTIDGKIMDTDGNEIVFGRMNKLEAEDTTTQHVAGDYPTPISDHAATGSTPTSDSSDAETEKAFTQAADVAADVEERPVRGRGEARGRARGPGRRGWARGRGRGARTFASVAGTSAPPAGKMYW